MLTLLNTESLLNEGAITGDKVGIKTTHNFDNIGGKVEAERALLVDVGGDLNHERYHDDNKCGLISFPTVVKTTLDRKALFHVKGEDGQLQLLSNNLNAKGADIVNDGNGYACSKQNNMNLTALSVGFDERWGKVIITVMRESGRSRSKPSKRQR